LDSSDALKKTLRKMKKARAAGGAVVIFRTAAITDDGRNDLTSLPLPSSQQKCSTTLDTKNLLKG
jgi:hypothetical protein